MDARFSDGPWEFSEGADGEFRIYAPLIPGATRAVFDVADIWTPDKGDRMANGYLIASCPKMYVALDRAAKVFREYEKLHLGKCTPDGDDKALKNAAEAIAIERILTEARGEKT